MSQLVVVVGGVGLSRCLLQQTAVVVLQAFIIYKIVEEVGLLLHLLLDYHTRGREAIDRQPVGDLVEADAVEKIVLAVDVELPILGVEGGGAGAGGGGGGGSDQSVEQGRTVWGGLRLY